MAGKVADEAKVTQSKKEEQVPDLTIRPQTNEELISQVANSSIKETMMAMMPMFQEMLSANRQEAASQVASKEQFSSIQSRVMNDVNKQFDQRMARNRKFVETLANSPKSDYRIMSIPQIYAKYFGSELPVGLNGSVIQVPINGRRFRVHKKFVPIINQALKFKDQKVAFMEDTEGVDLAEVSQSASNRM